MKPTLRRRIARSALFVLVLTSGGCEWLRNEFFIYDAARPGESAERAVSPFVSPSEQLKADRRFLERGRTGDGERRW